MSDDKEKSELTEWIILIAVFLVVAGAVILIFKDKIIDFIKNLPF